MATTNNPRDFDNCAHVTRSGKRCGALRWYHNDHARHKFVEPARQLTDAERADKLERMLVTVIDANYGASYHDYDNSHEQPPWNQPEMEYGKWVETERPEPWPTEDELKADERSNLD